MSNPQNGYMNPTSASIITMPNGCSMPAYPNMNQQNYNPFGQPMPMWKQQVFRLSEYSNPYTFSKYSC